MSQPTALNPATDVAFHDDEQDAVQTDTTWHTRLGWWIVLAGFGGFFVWASLAPLEKGVPLSGTVNVETSKKTVQHATGGTVEAILVKEGDTVKAGDVLVRMNNVQASADAEMTRVQYFTLLATEGRLLAESNGSKVIQYPLELTAVKDDSRVASNMALQQQLFSSRQGAKQSEWASIEENIAGLTVQNKGLEAAKTSKQQQLMFVQEQLDGMRDLTKSGFMSRARLLDVEQSYAQINAAIHEDIGNIGRGKRQITELTFKRQQSIQEYQKEVRTQLSDVRKEAGALVNRLSGLDYNLDNIVVKAPVAGTVIGLNVFAAGAVIAPGSKIMDIVPSEDPLIVEGRLPVHLVDKLHSGLDVELIFSAFNQNKTPHIPGVVTQVSADRLVDEKTGEPYYKLLAKVTTEGMQRVAHLKIRAGMPVDLFVKTGERTLMNYLFKPLLDHFSMSMVEE